jgi:hypothetical protein
MTTNTLVNIAASSGLPTSDFLPATSCLPGSASSRPSPERVIPEYCAIGHRAGWRKHYDNGHLGPIE